MKTKNKWGVAVGKPTKAFTMFEPDLTNIGRWVQYAGKPLSFSTRQEARKEAKEQSKFNRFWNFHAKKIS